MLEKDYHLIVIAVISIIVLTNGFISFIFFMNSMPFSSGILRSEIMSTYLFLLIEKCSNAKMGSVNVCEE